jgi:predicted nucleic acid-binding protein
MSRLIVDASVAVKWFISETHSEEALSILDGNHEMIVPDLLFAEIGNVLWKRTRSGDMTKEQTLAIIGALIKIPLSVRPISSLTAQALEIATQTQRTVYDSLYVALAVREGVPVVTADERLFNALRDTALQKNVVWIADFGTTPDE